jgi:hypothetical protein
MQRIKDTSNSTPCALRQALSAVAVIVLLPLPLPPLQQLLYCSTTGRPQGDAVIVQHR